MAQQSSIEWTQMTWNPTTGCDKVSAGCKFCYEEEYRGHDSSIYYDLPEINKNHPKNGVQNLIDSIKKTKEIIHNNFYYMYWEQENNLELQDVETATKKALEKLNIFTRSHANKIIKNKYIIDLSCIGKDMISLPNVRVNSRLIIEV